MDAKHPLRERLKRLPRRPGVYLMKDAGGKVIYVGKAARLRDRVRSYFAPADSLDPKTARMAQRIADFDYVITATEREALLLEDQLIKEYRPRYNIRLKDDKRYPWLKLTVSEPFPRLTVVRRPELGGDEYYGPYTDGKALRRSLKLLTQIFRVRTCTLDLPRQRLERPCLDYHIHRCDAPCVGWIEQEEYRQRVEELRLFLSGRSRDLIDRLRRTMQELSAALRFEDAARVRDQLEAVESMVAHQEVVLDAGRDVDVYALEAEGRLACGVVLRIRDGKLLHTEDYLFGSAWSVDPEAFHGRFLSEVMSRDRRPAREILLMHDLEDRAQWEELLSERLGRRVRLRVAQRGQGRRLVEMARTNARWKLKEALARRRSKAVEAAEEDDAALDLKERLQLVVAPHSIECFDMSHFQGSHRVGSLVYFQAGRPLKSRYRRFRIERSEGIDDLAMMREVLERYYSRLRDEDRLPADLVVVDGGAGQLSVAVETLRRYGFVETAVIGLAKREEEIHRPDRSRPLRLPRDSAGLKLLQRVRDEAHRFAVSYHRRLRGREMKRSVLDGIAGIGEVKKRALLEHFRSADAVGAATAEELLQVKGIGPGDARRILEFFARRQEK